MVLNDLKKEMRKQMLARLESPMYLRSDSLSEAEMASIANVAAELARTLAANAIGQAYQMGVNRSVTAEQQEATTIRAPLPIKTDDD